MCPMAHVLLAHMTPRVHGSSYTDHSETDSPSDGINTVKILKETRRGRDGVLQTVR